MGKKLREKVSPFRYGKSFSEEEAKAQGMRFVVGKSGLFHLYWLIDPLDGVIADVGFQAFGPIALLAAGEIASELLLRKKVHQAIRLSADLIDRHVRDQKDTPAFPKEAAPFLNQVLLAIEEAAEQCSDLHYPESYETTPLDQQEMVEGGLEGWELFSFEKKRELIEEVMEKEIRPYIALDAGNVALLKVTETDEVWIAYEGSCTTCHSATGSTLTAIQQILRARLSKKIAVIPDSLTVL